MYSRCGEVCTFVLCSLGYPSRSSRGVAFAGPQKECGGETVGILPQFIVASASAAEVYGVGDFYTQQYEFLFTGA